MGGGPWLVWICTSPPKAVVLQRLTLSGHVHLSQSGHTGHPRCCCGGRGECCFQPCLQSFSSLATLAVLYTLCSWQKGRRDGVFLSLPPPSSTCSSFTMSRFCHYNKPHFWGLVFWVRVFFVCGGKGRLFQSIKAGKRNNSINQCSILLALF